MIGQRVIYECPECGHVEGDHLWDERDVQEKGPPACPNGDLHGQLDMTVIPVVAAVLTPETLVVVAKAIARARFGLWHWATLTTAAQDECARAAEAALKAAGFVSPASTGIDHQEERTK